MERIKIMHLFQSYDVRVRSSYSLLIGTSAVLFINIFNFQMISKTTNIPIPTQIFRVVQGSSTEEKLNKCSLKSIFFSWTVYNLKITPWCYCLQENSLERKEYD